MAYDGQLKFETALDASGLQKGADKLGGIVKAGATALVAALAGASVAAVKVGADFEAGMSEVAAISGATGRDLGAITAKAKEMGATTKFSATESAEALKYMAMAGWDVDKMISGLPGVMNLAAASGENLATVSDIVTDAMTAFGLEASQAGRFADVLAKAASSSNTNVGLMGATFKYVAPIAGALGYSIDDTAVAIGLMANSGIKGEQAGTALRSMLTRLVKPTKQSAAGMEALGIEATNLDGTVKPLSQLIGELRTSFAALTDAEKAEHAALIAGQEAMSGMLAIVNASDADFANLTQAIQDSSGAAEHMAKTMNENLKGDMILFGSALEGLGIQIYDGLQRPLREAAQNGIKAIDSLSKKLKEPSMQNSLKSLAGAATAAAGVAIKALTGVLTHMDKLLPALTMLVGGLVAFKAAVSMEGIIKAFSVALKAAAVQASALAAGNTAAASAIVFQTTAEKALIVAVAAGNVVKSAAVAVMGLIPGAAAASTVSTLTLGGAFTALGVAIKAALGPIGLFIAVGTIIVAAVVAVAKALIDGSPANKQYKEEIKAMSKAHEELGDQLGESEKAFEATGPAIEAQAKQSEYLLSKVRELSKVENKSAAEKRELAVYVDRLNDAMGETVAVYDAETDALQIDLKAVQDMISAKKEMAIANALNERATEIAKELIDVDTELLSIERKRQQIADDTALSERERTRRLADLKTVEEDYEATRLEIAARLDAVTSQQVEHDTAAAEAVIENHNRMEQALTENGENIEDVAVRWGVSVEDIMAAWDRAGVSFDEFVTAQDAALAEWEASVKERTAGVVNSFKEIPGEYDKSATEMLEILQNNKLRYAEWEAAMEEITRQLGPTAAEEFAKLGPEATSAMQEILGSAELLDEYREVFGVKIDEATGTAVENWNDPNFIGAPSSAIDSSAQMVTQNTALDTALTDTMEGAKEAAEAVDFSVVGQNIAADIVGGLNSADVNGAMANITAAIQNNTSKVTSAVTSMSTSVQTVLRNMKTQAASIATQTMTEINSAIVSRSNTVKASATSMGNGVITSLNTMRTQAANVAMQMMTDINSAIVTRTSTVRASATAAANNVVGGLEPMVPGAENVANRMMDGIGTAMDRKAPSLYAKAREIANRIASIMADALDVHSPSRVMIRLFENVMLGIYEGMDGMAGLLYRTADNIADGLAERLTISKDVANALVEQMRTITNSTPLGGVALVPQAAYAGAGGGARYVTSLTQNITTPKPLSASEMTREGQDMLRRSRWQLP